MLDRSVEGDREAEDDAIPMPRMSPVRAQEAEVEEIPSTVDENSVFHGIMNSKRSQFFDSNVSSSSLQFLRIS